MQSMTYTVSMNRQTEPQLLKVSEAAALLHVSPQTVRDWTDQGKLESLRTSGGHRLYAKPVVQLCALKEKSVVSYWRASVNFQVSPSGRILYMHEDYSYQTSLQFRQPKESLLRLDAKGMFSNIVQLLVDDGETLTLTPATRDDPEVLSSPVEVFSDEEGNVRLSTFVEVLSFTEEGLQLKLEQVLQEALEWVKNNVRPVEGVVSWVDKKGNSFPRV